MIDHVAITDVAAYEAALAPAPAAAAPVQEPVVTETSYVDGDTSIQISTVITR